MAHNIAISKVENGVIVNVGCKTFVSEDIEGAMKEVARYLISPDAVEKEYNIKYNLGLTPPVDWEKTTLIYNGGINSGT